MNKLSLKISNFILKLEEDKRLFQWELEGVFIWELIRVKLFLQLQETLIGDSFRKISSSETLFKKTIGWITRLFCNAFFANPFFRLRKYDVLIFESGRKYKWLGSYIDIYTFFIREHLEQQGKQIEVYNTNHNFDKYNVNGTSHIDFVKFASKLLVKFKFVSFDKASASIVNGIKEAIQGEFKVDIDIAKLVKDQFSLFQANQMIYKRIMWLKRPKEIYIVNYIDHFALISAAKSMGVVINEIQHGLIIREALTYHFPSVSAGSLRYFPDRFLVWKEFKLNTGRLPLHSENIVSNEFNHLQNMLLATQGINKDPFSILVASQPLYSSKIFDFVVKNAEISPNINFYYKLHPMEFAGFDDFLKGRDYLPLPNVIFLKNQCSVYEVLKRSKFTLGIFSTLLYEATLFDSVPLVLLAEESGVSSSLLESTDSIAIDIDKPLVEQIK